MDPQANYMQLQVRRVEVVVVWTAVDLHSLGSLWFVDFPRTGRERARRRSSGRGRLPHLPNSCCHPFLLKKYTPWQSRRCPKSKFLAVERGKVLPRRPKSTLSKVRRCLKKKVKILRESDSIGRASQRPRTRLDECPDPVGSRPAPDTFPDPSPESDSSRFARSLNLPITTLDKKKEPSLRFAARRTLFQVWYHARSGAISAGQTRSATVRDFCPALIAPDRAWYHTWNSVLLSANLDDGSFFVQGSTSPERVEIWFFWVLWSLSFQNIWYFLFTKVNGCRVICTYSRGSQKLPFLPNYSGPMRVKKRKLFIV